MTEPVYRFAFAGDLVESVIDPIVLPTIIDTDGFVTWTVSRAELGDACFDPWRNALNARMDDIEGWADNRPEGLLLRFPGHATFAVERSGACVFAAPDVRDKAIAVIDVAVIDVAAGDVPVIDVAAGDVPVINVATGNAPAASDAAAAAAAAGNAEALSDVAFSDFVSHLLVDHVAPRRFAMLGENVLHATCVALPTAHGERALGLFGATGAGKSTLATYFVRRGARFVADDCLLLRPNVGAIVDGAEGSPCSYAAIPSYAGARLWGDSIEGVEGASGSAESSTSAAAVASWGKSQLDLAAHFDAAPVPVSAVVKLVRSQLSDELMEPRLERLSPSEATVTLVGTFFLNEKGGLSAPELLRRASELAKDLPVYRLTYPSGYEHLERAVSILRGQFALELPSLPPVPLRATLEVSPSR